MTSYTNKIVGSITDIDKSHWDALFGGIPEGYGFFKTIEQSGLDQFSLCYAMISDQKGPALIAPLFSADLDLGIAAEGSALKLVKAVRKLLPRFLISKTLFCGSAFGENAVLGIRAGLDDKAALTAELLKAIERCRKEKGCRLTLFKDFLKSDLPWFELLKENGFFPVNSFPSIEVRLPFTSFDQYFASLSSGTKKELKRKLKKTAAIDIQVKIAADINGVVDEVYGLYLNTYNAGTVKFEKLTKEFFINISRNLPRETRYFLYYIDDRLVVFNLCFLSEDLLIDKFIGFDYAYAYKYNLYFYSWCYNVRWCIENKITRYQVGQTDIKPKIKLGGSVIPLYACLKHPNSLVNRLFKSLSGFMAPEDIDE